MTTIITSSRGTMQSIREPSKVIQEEHTGTAPQEGSVCVSYAQPHRMSKMLVALVKCFWLGEKLVWDATHEQELMGFFQNKTPPGLAQVRSSNHTRCMSQSCPHVQMLYAI